MIASASCSAATFTTTPGGLRAAFHALGGEIDTGQFGEIPGGLRKRLMAAHPGHHPQQAGTQRGARHAQLPIPRCEPAAPPRAVVPGAPQPDRTSTVSSTFDR